MDVNFIDKKTDIFEKKVRVRHSSKQKKTNTVTSLLVLSTLLSYIIIIVFVVFIAVSGV